MATTPTQGKIKVDVYNTAGSVVSQAELDARIFGVAVKEGLVHQAVVAQAANGRATLASTKTKGEVRGGGKKPWKQKGTGRARHGSSRSPIWRGGGVTFGPRTERDYSQKMNKKAKRKALFMVLSSKVADGNIVLLDTFTMTAPKTKEASAILNKLPIQTNGMTRGIAVVTPAGKEELRRSLRNLPFVNLVGAHSLDLVKLLQAKKIVIPMESLTEIEKIYLKEE